MGEIPRPQEQLNSEEAETAAYAEKPLRDTAREEGVTPEEKVVMDKAAERKGKKAIDDLKAGKKGKGTHGGVDAVFNVDSGEKIYDAHAGVDNRTQDQKNYDKLREEEVAQREQQRSEALEGLGEGLSVKVHLGERAGERASIYKDGKHIGDIIAKDNLSPKGFTTKEFQDKAYGLLYGNQNPEQAEEDPLVEVGREGLTKKEMESNGMVISGNILNLIGDKDYPEIDLYSKGENARVDFKKIDSRKTLLLVTEKSGRTVEYTIDGGVFLPDSRKVRPPKK